MGDDQPQRRRSRSELKQLMLDAGRTVLLTTKQTAGFEDVTYARVFDHVKRTTGQTVTRGSVHERIWDSQREFQLEVLDTIVSATPQQIFDVANAGALEALGTADLTTPAGRRYTTQNVVRLIQLRGWRLAANLSAYESVALAVRFRLAAMDPGDPEVAVLARHIARQREAHAHIYDKMISEMMDTIGLQFKPALGADLGSLIAVLSNAITIGLSTDPHPIAQETRQLATGPNKEIEEWTTSGLGLWLVTKGLMELNDDTLTDAERQL